MRVAGLIPVGWYPTAVAVSADGSTLYVANGKGAGSGANPDGTFIARLITGSVSIIPVPDSTTLARYTRQVRSEEHTSELQSRPHLVCRLLLEKKKHRPHTQQPATSRP